MRSLWRLMSRVLRFGIFLSLYIILRVASFTPSRRLRGLSDKTIAELARKRYSSKNGDENDPLPMKGRVAVVTGAAGGIGGELSKTIFRLGGTVVALDRNVAGLEELQRSLQEDCFEGESKCTSKNSNNGDKDSKDQVGNSNIEDVQIRLVKIITNQEDLSSVASAANLILSRFDRIDLLVNNAGISYDANRSKSAVRVSAHQKDLAFTVNYLSHFLLTEKLIPILSKKGRIVHVTSTYHWKVDGSDLVPSSEDGVPIAYHSDPEKQRPGHLVRSYANTKLAQIWHSRSVASRLPEGCSSVCACPTWAATGIAGEKGRAFLGEYAFPIADCGPGITSAVNAMLRTDDELGDALNDGKSFVANTTLVQYKLTSLLLTNNFVQNTLGWRENLADMCAAFLLVFQKFAHEDFIIQKTSPESSNDKEKREKFYQWSKHEVKNWL